MTTITLISLEKVSFDEGDDVTIHENGCLSVEDTSGKTVAAYAHGQWLSLVLEEDDDE